MSPKVFIDALAGKLQSDKEIDQLARFFGYLMALFAVISGAWFAHESNGMMRANLAASTLTYAALAWQVPRTKSLWLGCMVFLQCIAAINAMIMGDAAVTSSLQVVLVSILWRGIELVASAALIRATFEHHLRLDHFVAWRSVLPRASILVVVILALKVALPLFAQPPWASFIFQLVRQWGIILWLVPRIELTSVPFEVQFGTAAPETLPTEPPPPDPGPSASPRPQLAAASAKDGSRRPAPMLQSHQLTLKSPQPPRRAPQADVPDPWLGRVLGDKLCLEAVAGRGGAGAVYRARHLDLDVLFAVKIIPKRDNLQVERFIREARLASNIPSDRVVRVFDCVEEEDFLCLTMEWIEGGTLADRLETNGTLQVDEACRVMEDVLDGFAAAHELGIVHRDVKPANIMLSSRGALLADFGIAREEDAVTITRHGAMLGTPAYVSPEQVLGESLDARSDLYSLAVVMFESIAGTLPFASSNPLALMMARVDDPPQRLDVARPGTPVALATLVNRALASDPARRFGSAVELKAAIARFRNA